MEIVGEDAMRQFRWSDILENFVVRITLSVLGFTYLLFMVVYPFTQGDWRHVQEVWDRWQALNVGVLAFAASVTAFNIGREKDRRQLQREFLSAKAMLPHALSELAGYCTESATYFLEALQAYKGWDTWVGLEQPPLPSPPEVPDVVFETFSKCVLAGEEAIAEHLVKVLSALQVHQARMSDLCAMSDKRRGHVANAAELPLTYLVALAKIRAYIDKVFDFARGEGAIDSSNPSLENLRTAYKTMGVVPETVKGLWERTEKAA